MQMLLFIASDPLLYVSQFSRPIYPPMYNSVVVVVVVRLQYSKR